MKTRNPFKTIKLIALLIIFCSSTSCTHYFRHITADQFSTQTIQEYSDANKYFILHSDTLVRHMTVIQISDDTVNATLEYTLGYQAKYLHPKEKGVNRFKKKKEPEIINAVHLYVSNANISKYDRIVSIPMSSIYTVKYNEYAQALSRASYAIPIVIFGGGAFIFIVGIIGLSAAGLMGTG